MAPGAGLVVDDVECEGQVCYGLDRGSAPDGLYHAEQVYAPGLEAAEVAPDDRASSDLNGGLLGHGETSRFGVNQGLKGSVPSIGVKARHPF